MYIIQFSINTAFSFTDKTAQYGVLYLYTVQAWNDDNLGSTRPEPVIATPRRNGPFDPIDGLKGDIVNGMPTLVWNTPKMKNVSPEKCLEDTVGYIVYRSDTKDGTYYQASPLLFENKWTDMEADIIAFNWYKVRVFDTGGYLSDFSEPLLIRQAFVPPDMETVIPELPDNIVKVADMAPKISFDASSYEVEEGMMFETSYSLSGTEPITIAMKAVNSKGNTIRTFKADADSRRVIAPSNLSPDTYTVTVTAKNRCSPACQAQRRQRFLQPCRA